MRLARLWLMKISFVPILFIISVKSSFADVVMRCGDTLYKYESHFFGTDEILVRWDGLWQPWCNKGQLEIKDYSATCWVEKEDERDFPTKSAVEYAYAFCKCGDTEDNSACFSRYGISEFSLFLSKLELGLEKHSSNHEEITDMICGVTDARSLDVVQEILRNQEDLLRRIFPASSLESRKFYQLLDRRIDFLGRVLQSDRSRLSCDLVDE